MKQSASKSVEDLTELTDNLFLGKVTGDIEDVDGYDQVILLSNTHKFKEELLEKVKDGISSPLLLHYPLSSNKKGSNELRKCLPEMIKKVDNLWDKKTFVLCDTGTDLSVGVCLILISLNYDTDWREKREGSQLIVTKDVIKRHLARISEKKNNVNPIRATLQSINAYLM